jgi:hypothetical protein
MKRAVTLLTVFAVAGSSLPTIGDPAASAAVSRTVHVWANGVNVRYDKASPDVRDKCDNSPSPGNCPIVRGVLNSGTYQADCQHQGATITYDGGTSNWWTAIHRGGAGTPWLGYVSHVFLSGPAKMPNLPVC